MRTGKGISKSRPRGRLGTKCAINEVTPTYKQTRAAGPRAQTHTGRPRAGGRGRGAGGTAARTWLAEAFVAGAHAAAAAVRAGAQRAEVHQLRAGRPGEARAAAAAEARAVRVAGRVVPARRRGARVHLLFAGGAEIPCGGAGGRRQRGRGKKKEAVFTDRKEDRGPAHSFSPV